MNEPEPLRLSDCAVVVTPGVDNVALAKTPLPAGALLSHETTVIRVTQELAPGTRFALSEVPPGGYLYQYGYPFARSTGILAGSAVGEENTVSEIPPFAQEPRREPPRAGGAQAGPSFMGYPRANGRCGTRNYYVVVPTSMCASGVAQQIAERFPAGLPGVDAVLALAHTEGCGCAAGPQIERLLTVLKNSILHENVAGALLVDLGCEQTNYAVVEKFLRAGTGTGGKPVEWLTIQKAGGAGKAVARGVEIVAARTGELSGSRRVPCPLSALTVGSECGASDAFSGVTANRVIGWAIDRVIGAGGAALFSEFPEMVGAEQALFSRMRSRAVIDRFKARMEWYRRLADAMGTRMEYNLVPENRAGGLINPFIKSLGAIVKGGTCTIEDVVDYAERIRGRGLYIMQGPGNDLESVTGLAASGANVICFSTGRGTVTGCALAPVIKISSTSELFARMEDDMDFDAGGILTSDAPQQALERLGSLLLQKVVAVASGEKSKPELNRQRQFQIWTAGKLSL